MVIILNNYTVSCFYVSDTSCKYTTTDKSFARDASTVTSNF